jgi:hypothetical protein
MLIRLLQQVTHVKLVQEVHPEAVPPPGWAESKFSNGKDKAQILSNLLMTVKVSVIGCVLFFIVGEAHETWNREGSGLR